MKVKDVVIQWRKSKTLTINTLVIAIMIAASRGWLGVELTPEEVNMLYTGLVIPVANIALRFFTKSDVLKKKSLLE